MRIEKGALVDIAIEFLFFINQYIHKNISQQQKLKIFKMTDARYTSKSWKTIKFRDRYLFGQRINGHM